MPGISSDLTRGVGGQPHPPPIWSCSGWGLPSKPVSRFLVRSYRTVAPLPGTQLIQPIHSILCRSHYPHNGLNKLRAGRYIFCGTSLKVTLTGSYPAPCPAELGLSSKSTLRSSFRDCLVYSVSFILPKISISPALLSVKTLNQDLKEKAELLLNYLQVRLLYSWQLFLPAHNCCAEPKNTPLLLFRRPPLFGPHRQFCQHSH